jgi:hypothetical protein
LLKNVKQFFCGGDVGEAARGKAWNISINGETSSDQRYNSKSISKAPDYSDKIRIYRKQYVWRSMDRADPHT